MQKKHAKNTEDIPSVQQSWKWVIAGFPKRKVVFQHPAVSLHDWREGNFPTLGSNKPFAFCSRLICGLKQPGVETPNSCGVSMEGSGSSI